MASTQRPVAGSCGANASASAADVMKNFERRFRGIESSSLKRYFDDDTHDRVGTLAFSVVASHVRWPNKALEPTRTAVTAPAEPGAAPAVRAAHL